MARLESSTVVEQERLLALVDTQRQHIEELRTQLRETLVSSCGITSDWTTACTAAGPQQYDVQLLYAVKDGTVPEHCICIRKRVTAGGTKAAEASAGAAVASTQECTQAS
jgi:hypothetical protein